MAKFLFDVQEHNKLKQVGILKRFTTDCIGNQPSKEEILMEKRNKFLELKDKKGTREYNMWFLKYTPDTEEGSKHSVDKPAELKKMTPIKQSSSPKSTSKSTVETAIPKRLTSPKKNRKKQRVTFKHRKTQKAPKSIQIGWL